ncbi:hypothetical protein [Actinomadura hibisca]|uniref:hypothetical protein n=1 Tax=Actinomadura hibisca TaxID=68565 RepID=UPI000B1858D0|nr:hypothetical protein [Actinomadura hibisca]
MDVLFVLAFLSTLAFFGLTGLWTADSRDGKDWRPTHWPTRPQPRRDPLPRPITRRLK